MSGNALLHRHGRHIHEHPHPGAHRHLRYPHRCQGVDHRSHDHSHGLIDQSIVRSRDGVRTVSISLAVLGLTAALQAAIFALSGSVALLADLIHNSGDALTAVPLGIAFFLRSFRGEKLAGLAVVFVTFVSACVARSGAVMRWIRPQALPRLWILA